MVIVEVSGGNHVLLNILPPVHLTWQVRYLHVADMIKRISVTGSSHIDKAGHSKYDIPTPASESAGT